MRRASASIENARSRGWERVTLACTPDVWGFSGVFIAQALLLALVIFVYEKWSDSSDVKVPARDQP